MGTMANISVIIFDEGRHIRLKNECNFTEFTDGQD